MLKLQRVPRSPRQGLILFLALDFAISYHNEGYTMGSLVLNILILLFLLSISLPVEL